MKESKPSEPSCLKQGLKYGCAGYLLFVGVLLITTGLRGSEHSPPSDIMKEPLRLTKEPVEAKESEEAKPTLDADQEAFNKEKPARQLAILHKMFHNEEPPLCESRFQASIDKILSSTDETDPALVADKIVNCYQRATEDRAYDDVTLLEVAEGLASAVVPDSGVTFNEVAGSMVILIKHNRKK